MNNSLPIINDAGLKSDLQSIQKLTQLIRQPISSEFNEAITPFVKLVKDNYREKEPANRQRELYQHLDETLKSIAQDNDHPLQGFARVELLIARNKTALNWEADNIRLPANSRQDTDRLKRILERTANQLGMNPPIIEKDYPTLRREFLAALRNEKLPAKIYIPYAHEGTKAQRGETPLSPHQIMGTSHAFAQTLETLQAITMAMRPDIKEVEQFLSSKSPQDTEKEVAEVYNLLRYSGLHPELDREALRKIDPIKRTVIEMVAAYFCNCNPNHDDMFLRQGGLAISHKIDTDSLTFLKAHKLDVAHAAFLFKDAIEHNKAHGGNWLRTMIRALPKRVSVFLDQKGFLSDGILPAGVDDARYALIMPQNPAISSRTHFRQWTEVNDPEMDYTLSISPVDRALGTLYHELAHVFSQVAAEEDKTLVYRGKAGKRKQEMISDVFSQLCTGKPANKRDRGIRALRSLLGDSEHCTFHAIAAITDEEYEAAKHMSFAQKHALAMEISQRAAFDQDEDGDIDRIRHSFSKPKLPLNELEQKLIDHIRDYHAPHSDKGSLNQLMTAALDDIAYIKSLKHAHHPSYTEDVLTTMRMTGTVAGAVETLAFEKEAIRQELSFLLKLSDRVVSAVGHYGLLPENEKQFERTFGEAPLTKLRQKTDIAEMHCDRLDQLANIVKANIIAELKNTMISKTSAAIGR